MFAIVEWVGSDPLQVSAVPSNWLVTDADGNLSSYWPSSSSESLAFKQRWGPKSGWEKFRVRQIGTAESYEQAMKKQDKAQLTSDLSADEASAERTTRHERCRIEFSDNDVPTKKTVKHGASSQSKTNSLPRIPLPAGLRSAGLPTTLVPAAVKIRPSFTVAGNARPQQLFAGSASATAAEPAIVTTVVAECTASPLIASSSTSALRGFATDSFMSPPAVTPVRSRPPSTIPCIDNSPSVMQALQQICRQTAETKEQVLYNTQLLQDLARRQRGVEKEKVGRLPASCQLPLKTYEEVLTVEKQLKSKDFYCQFVAYLSLIGGATIKDFVSRAMSKVFDCMLARKFVWVGRLTNKHAFMTLELKNAVVEATRRNPLTSRATEAEIDEELKLWLRGAPDRNGGRSVRAKKAAIRKKQKASRSSHRRDHRSFSSGRDRDRSSSHDRGHSSSSRRGRSRHSPSSAPDRSHRSTSSAPDQSRRSRSSLRSRRSGSSLRSRRSRSSVRSRRSRGQSTSSSRDRGRHSSSGPDRTRSTSRDRAVDQRSDSRNQKPSLSGDPGPSHE